MSSTPIPSIGDALDCFHLGRDLTAQEMLLVTVPGGCLTSAVGWWFGIPAWAFYLIWLEVLLVSGLQGLTQYLNLANRVPVHLQQRAFRSNSQFSCLVFLVMCAITWHGVLPSLGPIGLVAAGAGWLLARVTAVHLHHELVRIAVVHTWWRLVIVAGLCLQVQGLLAKVAL